MCWQIKKARSRPFGRNRAINVSNRSVLTRSKAILNRQNSGRDASINTFSVPQDQYCVKRALQPTRCLLPVYTLPKIFDWLQLHRMDNRFADKDLRRVRSQGFRKDIGHYPAARQAQTDPQAIFSNQVCKFPALYGTRAAGLFCLQIFNHTECLTLHKCTDHKKDQGKFSCQAGSRIAFFPPDSCVQESESHHSCCQVHRQN